jgi:hypothetical protein
MCSSGEAQAASLHFCWHAQEISNYFYNDPPMRNEEKILLIKKKTSAKNMSLKLAHILFPISPNPSLLSNQSAQIIGFLFYVRISYLCPKKA